MALAVTSPGIVFEDLLILGMRVGEGPGPAAPGPIRAYNVRTGALVWRFNTIPHPGEFGYETWPPDAYKHVGGANVWTGMSLDAERGWVFCPTGAAAFDFWGGNRLGENLFANCLIALDARTGERIWHFQFVRHDLWDRDLPAPPNLVTVIHEGQPMDAVAQTTKSGHVFVFNRDTGEPLFPMEEVAAPRSDLDGEAAWPTQPLPTKPEPFSRQHFTVHEINDLLPESYQAFLDRFVTLQPHAPFAPPSTRGTIIFPGFDGGAEWGGAAVDPEGVLYVNANEMPWVLTMVEASHEGQPTTAESLYRMLCAPCHGLDLEGNVAQSVPTLMGVEQRLNHQAIKDHIRTGKNAMPSFGFLSENQLEALASYILDGVRGEIRSEEEPGMTASLGGSPYTHTGYNRWLDTNGYPAVKPPWGTLNAIDLNTGEYRWRTTLGEEPALMKRGIPPTGTENYGGPIVTAGGLLFIAASRDEHIRAFDIETGQELWKTRLPAGGYATPTTYSIDGRQFVVIACGGGKMRTKSGDAYLAFALPE
jgi:quinoprotein glucose dehydrogenase